MGGFGCFLRYGWRVVVASVALLLPSVVPAAEIYIGIAPGSPSATVDPGVLIRASDTTGSGVVVGDAFPSDHAKGYGGLAFDSTGNLWATVGIDDAGGFGDEYGTLASTLVQIDPATGSVIQTIGPIHDATNASIGIVDLAIQPGTNVLFGINTSKDVGPQPCDQCLYTIDALSGLATLVGMPAQGSTRVGVLGLTFTPDGTLYGNGIPFGYGGQTTYLYTMNPLNGSVLSTETVVRDPNDPNPSPSSMAANGLGARPADGTIFGTLCCTNEIVYHDNATHLWRVLGSTGLPNGNTYADLAFAPTAVPTPLPASIWLFGSGLAALVGLRRRGN
jgi:hypothetical protein